MVYRDTTTKVRQEALRTLAFGGIGAAHAIIGTAIADEAELVSIVNNTDADLIVSLDGVTDHIFMPMYSSYVIDYQSDAKQLGNRTAFYVKHNGVAPTVGAIYVEVTV